MGRCGWVEGVGGSKVWVGVECWRQCEWRAGWVSEGTVRGWSEHAKKSEPSSAHLLEGTAPSTPNPKKNSSCIDAGLLAAATLLT